MLYVGALAIWAFCVPVCAYRSEVNLRGGTSVTILLVSETEPLMAPELLRQPGRLISESRNPPVYASPVRGNYKRTPPRMAFYLGSAVKPRSAHLCSEHLPCGAAALVPSLYRVLQRIQKKKKWRKSLASLTGTMSQQVKSLARQPNLICRDQMWHNPRCGCRRLQLQPYHQ